MDVRKQATTTNELSSPPGHPSFLGKRNQPHPEGEINNTDKTDLQFINLTTEAQQAENSRTTFKEHTPIDQEQDQQIVKRAKLKDVMKHKLKDAPTVIIDCDFADIQNDRELASIVVQISECIHTNKRSQSPVNIRLSGLHDKLREKLQKQQLVLTKKLPELAYKTF